MNLQIKEATHLGGSFFGGEGGICLHFRLWRKLRFRCVKSQRATLVRVAFDRSNPSVLIKETPSRWTGFFYGGEGGICLHFRLWRKLRFRCVEPQRATLVRVAFDRSNPSVLIKEPRPDGRGSFMAEKEGFEPSIPFWGIHDFQSCALGQLRDFSISAKSASHSILPHLPGFVKPQFTFFAKMPRNIRGIF